MRKWEQELVSFVVALVIAGIAAAIINSAAINAGYSTQMAFEYALGSFFALLLIFYGLIYVVIRR